MFDNMVSSTIPTLVMLATGCAVLYALILAIYNIWFHPLSRYPGPKILAAYRLPFVYYHLTSCLPLIVKDLHEQYGPVVRIAPDELAFVSAKAHRDIYAHRQGLEQNPKDAFTYVATDKMSANNLILADNAKHSRQRSQLSHAFSSKALQQQEPLISTHIDTLINKLHNKIGGKPQDICTWFNWITFDIIADLTFGESFGCLEKEFYHPWVKVIFDGIRAGATMQQLARYGTQPIFEAIIPKSMMRPRQEMVEFSVSRTDKRLELGTNSDRPDFTSFMLRGTKKGDPAMTPDEMYANAEVLVVAGSETTGTQLSGLTHLLLTKRPDYLARVVEEVRGAFSTDNLDEMNFQTVSQRLPLLSACLNEALRFYPPAPFGFARVIQGNGTEIDDHFVPAGTSVSVFQYAANHYSQNWYKPEEFLPERWLTGAAQSSFGNAFENDQKDACRPFSAGPRGCLGRNLAEVEARLIYARLLWNFDIELVEGQDRWMVDQGVFLIWQKSPLMVRLKLATRTRG